MFTVAMAGLHIGIAAAYPYTLRQCTAFLTQAEPDFTVSATKGEILAEQELEGFSLGYCESICLHRHIAGILPRYDAFVMHTVTVERGGRAFLFAAPSGTGKTTHARYWLKAFDDAAVLNGDKTVIRKLNGVFHACGTPWLGREKLGSDHIAPIAGLCLISRGDTDEITRTSAKELLPRLFKQLYIPPQPDEACAFLELLNEFTRTVPLYAMHCTMSVNAAITAYNAMSAEMDFR